MNKKAHILYLLGFIIATVVSLNAGAKPMPQRLGIGIKDNTTQSIPSLAAIYNVNENFGLFGGLGFDTQKDYSKMQVNAGLRHVIFHETNLHFYTAGQLAIVNLEDPVEKQNGFELNVLIGAEFFLTGLENLGFSFEGGVGLASYKETRTRTVGDHPLKAGIIFYF